MDRISHAADVVVLHVLSDAAQFVDHRDADPAEMLGIADTGNLQEVRRADCPGREDDLAGRLGPLLAATAGEFDPDCTFALEQHAVHQRVCHELQIRPLQGRPQIGARGAGAAATAASLLAPADTIARSGRQIVDVLAVFEADFLAGLDHDLTKRRPIHTRGEERAALAAHLGFLALPALGFAEIGQAVVPRPAAVAELRPVVIIFGLAADIDQPVDRARPAEHLPARIEDRAPGRAGIGLGVKPPGKGRMVEELHKACGDMDIRAPVAARPLRSRSPLRWDLRSADWPGRNPPSRHRRLHNQPSCPSSIEQARSALLFVQKHRRQASESRPRRQSAAEPSSRPALAFR